MAFVFSPASSATFCATARFDFPDEILAELDYAVASVHSVFKLTEAEMTERIIRAMDNPFITILAASHRPFAPETRTVRD